MATQLKQNIFAGLTIGANLRDFDRLGEVDEFVHIVADVLVDDEAKTLHVVKKESLPIDRDALVALLGIEGLDLAHQAARGAAAAAQLADASARIVTLQAALDQAHGQIDTLRTERDAARQRNSAAAHALTGP